MNRLVRSLRRMGLRREGMMIMIERWLCGNYRDNGTFGM